MNKKETIYFIGLKIVDWVCLENVCGFYPVYKRFSATHWEKVTSDTSIVSLEALEEIYQAHLKDIEEKKESIMEDIYEWKFPEPSHLVDIERVYREVNSIPAIVAHMYMGNLKAKAPIVFERLRIFAKEQNVMNWYAWGGEKDNE